jgi:uncharacterized surface protein with fasciclin (FAS1) repeats
LPPCTRFNGLNTSFFALLADNLICFLANLNPNKIPFMNRLSSIMRYAAALALVGGLFVVSSCDEPDPAGPTLNIMDLISSDTYKQSANVPADKALDTLVYYLERNPDLVTKLESSTEFTFFAPSNAAFASLKATAGFPTNPDVLKLINPALIAGVLSYHIVEGENMKAELTSGTVLDTEFTDPLAPTAPQQITVNADGTLKGSTLSANTAIDIVTPDGDATNGVVHVIESVIIPPSTGAVLVPILGKVAGTVVLSKDFTNLVKVIMAADQAFTESPTTGQFKIITWLAMPISTPNAATLNPNGITFFAPPNAAGSTPIFTETAANGLIAAGADACRNFLLNHIVVAQAGTAQTSGQYTVAAAPANNPNMIVQFANAQTITPLRGQTKTIYVSVGAASATNPNGVAVTNVLPTPAPTDFRPILLKDVPGNNGYLQAIGGALQ